MCENKRKLRNLFMRVRMHMGEVSKAHVRSNELEAKEVSTTSSYAYVRLRVRKPLNAKFLWPQKCVILKKHMLREGSVFVMVGKPFNYMS